MAKQDVNPFERLIEELTAIRRDLLALAETSAGQLNGVFPAHAAGAANLLHYVALRRHELRELQERLTALGLSSLGRAEPCVLATVDAVLRTLHHLAGSPGEPPEPVLPQSDFVRGRDSLRGQTAKLLGPAPAGRSVRIMVTMPGEAADDYALVRDLLAVGMDCMRINCAHDGPSAWEKMIAHLRRAEKELTKSCRVQMDLAGPKLRTGALQPGPRVVKWRPRRDCCGRVTAPAQVWLTPQETAAAAATPADATLPLPGAWLARLGPGDRLRFRDARGASRSLTVTRAEGHGCWAESAQTSYVMTGTVLRLCRPGGRALGDDAPVGELPPMVIPIVLHVGDTLILTRDPGPGRPAVCDRSGRLRSPARLPCTLPEVLGQLKPRQTVWFDDGKIGGVVRQAAATEVHVKITLARPDGDKLGADKGINLPDSDLRLPALTEQDLHDLDFVADHADLIGLSFIHRAADVEQLHARLSERNRGELGIVLKIETRQAFEQLPEILLAAMRSPSVGVMIARGDLAVECGFERLAELQEEILWMCEAAHLPVIWATQVLEHLAKEGAPSRAEITDAAMGERAECVMLNKGPHIVAAVRALADILHRMQDHQHKKRSMLRKLRLADRFPAGAVRT